MLEPRDGEVGVQLPAVLRAFPWSTAQSSSTGTIPVLTGLLLKVSEVVLSSPGDGVWLQMGFILLLPGLPRASPSALPL